MEKIEFTQAIAALKTERDKAICNDFIRLKGTAAPYNLFFRLAVEYGMTAQGVANIVKAAGLYVGREEHEK